MNTHFFDRYSQYISRGIYFFVWIIGILLGVIAAANRQNVAAEILKGALSKSPSLISCVLLGMARILIICLALRYRWSVIVYALLFTDAFCFGFCGIAIYLAAGEAAWLLRPLFLFSRIWCYIPIWWLLLHNTPSSKMLFTWITVFCCLVVFTDFIFVVPMLLDLVKYL